MAIPKANMGIRHLIQLGMARPPLMIATKLVAHCVNFIVTGV